MSISSLTVWEVDSTGSDSNGGGFVAGSTGTDKTYVVNGVSTATTRTDLATGTIATNVSSATAFTAGDVGNLIQITAGTGWTTKFYQIVSVAGGVATLDSAPAAASTSGGTGTVGGALATPAKAAAAMVAGNRCWIKAATYPATTAPVMTLGFGGVQPTSLQPYTIVSGYYQTRGDITYGAAGVNSGQNGGADHRPIFQFQTGATTGLSLLSITTGYVIVSGLILDCNSIASSSGVSTNGGAISIRGCLAKNFAVAGFLLNQSNCSVERCEATAGKAGAYGFQSSSAPVYFHGCNAHDNAGYGFRPDNGASMSKCFSVNNASHGVYLFSSPAVSIVNCTIVGNGGDGVHNGNSTVGVFIIKDNVIADNGGWGILACSSSGFPTDPMFDGNTYYGNVAGNIGNLVSGAFTSLPYANNYDKIAAADPVVSHATGGNFSPSSVSPGLAARHGYSSCRATRRRPTMPTWARSNIKTPAAAESRRGRSSFDRRMSSAFDPKPQGNSSMAALVSLVNLPSTPLAAGVAKTVLQLKAPTNQRLRILSIGLFCDGVTNSAVPVQIQYIRQSSPGTSLVSATPAPLEAELTETVQTTAQVGSQTTQSEPGTTTVLQTFTIPAFMGQYEVIASPGQEIIVPGGGYFGIVAKAAAAVNVYGFIRFEE